MPQDGRTKDSYLTNGTKKSLKKHGIKDYRINKEELKNKSNYNYKENKNNKLMQKI